MVDECSLRTVCEFGVLKIVLVGLFFVQATPTLEIKTRKIVGSVRCV